MEGVNGFSRKLENVRSHLVEQGHALGALQEALAGESEHLRRLDQARIIRDLRSRVEQQIEEIQHVESIASCAFNIATLIGGGASFLLGTIVAAASGSCEHPLSVGERMATEALEGEEPYGRVLVAVGPCGVPNDVEVIAVSQWARESGRSEEVVEAAIRAKGHVLLTPDVFFERLASIERGVLGGAVVLPASAKSLLPPPVITPVVWVARKAIVVLPVPSPAKTSVSAEKQP